MTKRKKLKQNSKSKKKKKKCYKVLFMIRGMLSAYSKRNLLICNVHNFHGLILFKGRLIVVVLLL